MADTPENTPSKSTANDRPKTSRQRPKAALEKQVAQMKREIASLNKQLTKRADETNGWYDSAVSGSARATKELRAQAQTISEAVRDNPGTVSSAMFLGGVVGFILGCVFSQATSDTHRRWH
ncbi:hypothetical protein [Aquamicrobium sp. LC103]|uniref:hypothetical protein n=1 Tax=Aquamicrobium sp. LC103 TaxID=1120658 RepID=UPI000AD4EAEF|nr:hypothetical protein [Aquamicrobium sp. LC103]